MLGLPWSLFGILAGYGYRPERLIVMLFTLWAAGGFVYQRAAEANMMAPSNASVYLNKALNECHGHWTSCSEFDKEAPEYPRFNALVYSADLLLPVVDLGQKRLWSPVAPHASGGAILLWVVEVFVLLQTAFGWIAGLILAGVATSYLIRLKAD